MIHWITKTDKTQLSPYYQQTQAVPQKPWFKPPYASGESDEISGNENPQQQATPRPMSYPSTELKNCPRMPPALVTPKRSSLDLDRIMVSPRPLQREFDGETLRGQSDSTDSMSTRGILQDPKSYP